MSTKTVLVLGKSLKILGNGLLEYDATGPQGEFTPMDLLNPAVMQAGCYVLKLKTIMGCLYVTEWEDIGLSAALEKVQVIHHTPNVERAVEAISVDSALVEKADLALGIHLAEVIKREHD